MSLWQRVKLLIEGNSDSGKVTAICIPPGARLRMEGIPENLQTRWRVAAEEEVLFVQAVGSVNTHRDSIRFRNGHQTLLHNLPEGLCVQVLSMEISGEEAKVRLAEARA